MTSENNDESWIEDEWRAKLNVDNPPYTLELDRTSVRMFARAIGYTDKVFYDPEEAKRRGYKDIIAPPGYLGTRIFDPDQGEIPLIRPKNLQRGLNGGNIYEYYEPITAGDTLEATMRMTDIRERHSSVGHMVITIEETRYKRVSDGKIVAKKTSTLIAY
jgi:hypothetical protein